MTPEMVDFQYFGTMPGIPPYRPRPSDEDPERTARMQEFLNWVFSVEDLPELRELRDEIDALVSARPDLQSLANAELIARARSLVPVYRRVFERHITISGATGVGIGTVAGVCQAIGDPSLVMRLVVAAGDVDSAAPSLALWDLSRRVAASPTLTKTFDGEADGLVDRLTAEPAMDAAHAEFRAEFDRFLEAYGSRGPNEWELRSHTWGTHPHIPLAAVERMRLAANDESPSSKFAALAADRDAVAEQVRVALAGDPDARAQFDAGLRAALLFSAGRERTKSTNIKVVHEQRLALRELGRRMVEGGHLATIESIFMLLDDELDDFVADPAKYATTIADRERAYLDLFELEPPFVLDGAPPPLSAWPRRARADDERVAAGTILQGIPGCPGQATGTARVILDPSDPAALGPGDVLIAPVTDPAWTPLFVPAAAVVVDVGAQITHAVIVSRELGIPCVVSVTGATRKIADGATVTVDGTTGTVTVH
jgi:pyruvate,water dikinase